MPAGLPWDERNYSCAYDSIIPILLQIWRDNPNVWGKRLSIYNELSSLPKDFEDVEKGRMDLKEVRGKIKGALNSKNPVRFPEGMRLVDIHQVLRELFTMKNPFQEKVVKCPNQNCGKTLSVKSYSSYLLYTTSTGFVNQVYTVFDRKYDFSTQNPYRLSDWWKFARRAVSVKCKYCKQEIMAEGSQDLQTITHFLPPIIGIQVYSSYSKIDKEIRIMKNETVNQTYRLSGIIYLLIDHYFCRVVDHKNQVWFSDGRKFAGQFELDGSLQQMSDEDLNKLGSCIAQVAIYSKNP